MSVKNDHEDIGSREDYEHITLVDDMTNGPNRVDDRAKTIVESAMWGAADDIQAKEIDQVKNLIKEASARIIQEVRIIRLARKMEKDAKAELDRLNSSMKAMNDSQDIIGLYDTLYPSK